MSKQGFKQRITGAIVIVALGVIFLPMAFDGKNHQTRIDINIPSPPTIDFSASLPQTSELDTDFWADDPTKEEYINDDALSPKVRTNLVAKTEEITNTVREPRPSKLLNAWTIKVGAFANEHNATNLLNNLQAKGYPTYQKQRDKDDGKLTVLYVGPMLNETEAKNTLGKIENEFNLKGSVINYKPKV